MEIVQPARLDLVGDAYRMYLGAYWRQPFTYFAQTSADKHVAQVIEALSPTSTGPSGDQTGPTYEIRLADGPSLSPVISVDTTVWAVGDWVLASKIYGQWKIVNPGKAPLEDLTPVLRAVLQVRDRAKGRVILTLDSADSGDVTKPSVRLSPTLSTSLELYCPPQFTIAPSTYEYDLFFYHSLTEPYGPVMRQFGKFEIFPSITQRGS